MRRIKLLIVFFFCSFSVVYSQHNKQRDTTFKKITTYYTTDTTLFAKKKQTFDDLKSCYVNLGFASKYVKFNDNKIKSIYGISFTGGRTFFLNRNKPIGKILRFCIDLVWVDLNYVKSSHNITKYSTEKKTDYHQVEAGLQVGPSINIIPIESFVLHGYFRISPSYSIMGYDDIYGSYASFFVTGINISYGAVGYGVEKRWGSCKYTPIDENENSDQVGQIFKTNGFRFYINFKF